MPLVALFVTDRYSLTDSRQILKSECLARDGGFLHQGLADTVVGVFLETALLARYRALRYTGSRHAEVGSLWMRKR